MFSLYLKTHNQTGLKYLGYTKNDPMKYKGSGVYWKSHLSKHGNDVTTEILFQSESIDELSGIGKYYSALWDISNDESFANLCEEDGNKLFGKANINFRGHSQSAETRKKISENNGRGNAGKFGSAHPSYGHRVSENNAEHLAKAQAARRGKKPWNYGKALPPISDKHKSILSESNKGPKPIVVCPKCGKSGGKPAMIRFHFDNCRSI